MSDVGLDGQNCFSSTTLLDSANLSPPYIFRFSLKRVALDLYFAAVAGSVSTATRCDTVMELTGIAHDCSEDVEDRDVGFLQAFLVDTNAMRPQCVQAQAWLELDCPEMQELLDVNGGVREDVEGLTENLRRKASAGRRLYIVNHDVHAAHGTDLWLRFVSAMLQWLSTCTQTSWSFAIICPQNPGDREETESIVRLGFQPAYVDHAGGDDGSDSEPFSEFWYLIPERLAGTTQHNVAAAFLMGLHPRLGSTSPVATLDENIASIILNFLFRVPSQMEAKRLLESLLAPPPSVSERDRPLVGLIQYVASQCWQKDVYRSTHPIPEALVLERFLLDPGITGPPGEHFLYWDQISYTRFLFDFW